MLRKKRREESRSLVSPLLSSLALHSRVHASRPFSSSSIYLSATLCCLSVCPVAGFARCERLIRYGCIEHNFALFIFHPFLVVLFLLYMHHVARVFSSAITSRSRSIRNYIYGCLLKNNHSLFGTKLYLIHKCSRLFSSLIRTGIL